MSRIPLSRLLGNNMYHEGGFTRGARGASRSRKSGVESTRSVTGPAEHLAGGFPKQVTSEQGGGGGRGRELVSEHNDTVELVVKGEILPLLIKICPRNTLPRGPATHTRTQSARPCAVRYRGPKVENNAHCARPI